MGQKQHTTDVNVDVDAIVATDVVLMGRNAKVLKEWLNQTFHIGVASGTRVYGNDIAGGSSLVTPLNVEMVSNRAIYILNSYNQALSISISGFSRLTPSSTPHRFSISTNESLAAGAGKLYDVTNLVQINSPFIGISVSANSGTTAPTTGQLDIIFLGGV